VIDKEAQTHWKDYSEARNKMLIRTSYKYAPWFVVNADKKKLAHTAILTHLLGRLDHKKDKKLLAHDYGLIYPVTQKNFKEKLF
jgi:polyphosphate kinase 2 (PPK2 family)